MALNGSYNDSLPTDRDTLRALLGDTTASAWLLSDDHLNAVLSLKGSLAGALAFCADELIARFAQQPVSQTTEGQRVDHSERISTWRLISAQAKADAAIVDGSNGGYGIGALTTTAPIAKPDDRPFDANDPAYRGDPYRPPTGA